MNPAIVAVASQCVSIYAVRLVYVDKCMFHSLVRVSFRQVGIMCKALLRNNIMRYVIHTLETLYQELHINYTANLHISGQSRAVTGNRKPANFFKLHVLNFGAFSILKTTV